MIKNDLTATGKAAFVKSVMSPALSTHPASNAYDGVISSLAPLIVTGLGTRAISKAGLANADAYFEGTFNGCKKITSFDIYPADSDITGKAPDLLKSLDKAIVTIGTNPCLTIAAASANTALKAFTVKCASPAYGTSIKISKDKTGAILSLAIAEINNIVGTEADPTKCGTTNTVGTIWTKDECQAWCQIAANNCLGYQWDASLPDESKQKCWYYKKAKTEYGLMITGDNPRRLADKKDLSKHRCFVKKKEARLVESNRFTQMIWAEGKKVAFGVKGPWVVAWYCPAGNKPAVGEPGSPAAFKLNVKKTCIENGMNACYNTMALKAINAKRLLHQETDPLVIYEAAAEAIQAEMDKPGFAGVMPAESARPKEFQDCAESIYTETSTLASALAAVATSNVAIETWYTDGDAAIDYATGKPKVRTAANNEKVDRLLYMIWKTTRKVAFGVRDKWVVSWYCDVRPLTALAKVGVENVQSSPLLDLTAGSRRRLSSAGHRLLAAGSTNVASNANDGDNTSYMQTLSGVGMFWSGEVRNPPMQISAVKLRNAPAPADPAQFTLYRVLIDGVTCGTTPAVVGSGEEVVVNCGLAPAYISGVIVRVETTTKTSL